MGDQKNLVVKFDDLPLHLILEILTCGWLGGVDLVCLELSCKLFRDGYELGPVNFKSLGEFAAFRLCGSNSVFVGFSDGAKDELLARCGGCWKRVLRFLQSVNESSDVVQTYSGNV
ncbi:putative E3 ubiquitin-protein ligase HERC4 [Artemisia annua]|uniref:Putative E3 ubiquitin-protein ligase HERC4 n=1 Tax=Artemisia annua TaxID=35608 RepID=A0A2U1K8U5_ARTAN|nr:putative E3 ubiquitin-protein ligase HERC4 [Artemisia annua]